MITADYSEISDKSLFVSDTDRKNWSDYLKSVLAKMSGLNGGGRVRLERHEPLNRLSSTSAAGGGGRSGVGVTNRNEALLHEMFKFRLEFEQGSRTRTGGSESQLEGNNQKLMLFLIYKLKDSLRGAQFRCPWCP